MDTSAGLLRCGRLWRCCLAVDCTVRFVANQLPDLLDQLAEAWLRPSVLAARPRQVDRDYRLHSARVCAHHDDAVGQEHGLLDVMGNEERRLARRRGPCLAPDPQELDLQDEP